MLDGNDHILRAEHRAIFGLSIGSGGLRIVELFIALMFAEPRTGTSFAFIYSIFEVEPVMSPIYSFIVFACVMALTWRITTTRFIVAAFLLSLLAWFFISWFLEAQRAITFAIANQSEAGLIDYNPFLVGGSYYDVISFVAAIILLGWCLTIILRIVGSTTSLRINK